MAFAPERVPVSEVFVRRALLLSLLMPALAVAQTATPPTTPPASDSSAAPAAAAPAPGAAPAATPATKSNNPLANAVQARTPEEQANQSGFQFAFSLDHYLGAGTFVDTRYYSYLAAWLTLQPQYLFSIGKQRLVASATIRGSWEYTLPDVETGRRWGLFDTRIGIAAPAFFREKITRIAFTPIVGLLLPTSLESWNAGLITSISAGFALSRSIGVVDFRLNASGSRAIYGQSASGYRNPTLNGGSLPRDSNGNLLVVCRPEEPFCASAGMNPAWSLSVGGQVQWRATGSFLLYSGFTYIRAWREAATPEVDQFTPKALDANGNPVARAGLGTSDRTSAFFGGSYQLNEHYSIDLGISTVQTPLRPTGEVRFPFLSFGNWADNGTSLYFSLSAAY
jgi:hypothetical protein